MIAAGRSPSTAHQVHRTLRAAFGQASRRGRLHAPKPSNLKDLPQGHKGQDQAVRRGRDRKLIEVALHRFGGVRWIIALALGLRQGELLALQWERHRPGPRSTHRDLQPRPPAVPARMQPALRQEIPGWCPERVRINPERGETKSDASQRTIGMPAELTRLLRAHRAEQAAAQARGR